jgi:hypothetical protein
MNCGCSMCWRRCVVVAGRRVRERMCDRTIEFRQCVAGLSQASVHVSYFLFSLILFVCDPFFLSLSLSSSLFLSLSLCLSVSFFLSLSLRVKSVPMRFHPPSQLFIKLQQKLLQEFIALLQHSLSSQS